MGASVVLVDAGGQERLGVSNDRGETVFDAVPAATYSLHVTMTGFEAHVSPPFVVGTRRVTKDVVLALARFADAVQVTVDDVDRYLANAFSSVLSQDALDALPDDPDDLEQALKDLAGPGAQIAVNGFRGGRLPPKSQIREIRIRFDPYDAEFHEPGFPRVDILTKAGLGAWQNALSLGFRDDALNARNALAPERGAEQNRRFTWTLDGPLVRRKTSFSLNVGVTSAYDSQTIVAAMPEGPYADVVRQPNDRITANLRLEHSFSPTQFLKVELQHSGTERRNQGVGDFELLDHAFTATTAQDLVRVSQTSTIRKRIVNDLRAELCVDDARSRSASDATTIVVLDAFTSGGSQLSGGRRGRRLEAVDTLDVSVGSRHAMRAGVWFDGGRFRSDESRNGRGTFTFASLAAYLAGRPTTYTERRGDPLVEYGQFEAAFFLHDTIRVNKRLQVGVGVRHELQAHLRGWTNPAPRASVTWVPTARNTSTVRAGFGVFHEWYDASTHEQTLRVDGTHQSDLVVRDAGYPDPLEGGRLVVTPPSVIRVDRGLTMPTLVRGSFGIEQQLAGWMRVRTNVVLQRGFDVLRSINVNAPIDGVRPDSRFGNISRLESTGRSTLREATVGLNVNSVKRRLFSALTYRWAEERNEADDAFSLPSDSRAPSKDWGPSRQDVRHSLFGFASMPLAKGFRAGLSYRLQSGTPYTMTTGFDDNGDTVINDRPAGIARNSLRGRPTQNLDVRLSWGRGLGRGRPGAGAGGPQVVLRRPGDEIGDLPGGPRGDAAVTFELYAQSFNLLNHVNLQRYTGVLTSPFFGTATSAQPPRRLELGARVSF